MALALHKGFGREKDENLADLWRPLMSHPSYQNDGKILTWQATPREKMSQEPMVRFLKLVIEEIKKHLARQCIK